MIFIGVIGDATCEPEVAALAEEVGRELGRRGVGLVCGGLGGVMEAACRGASGEGGLTVGILPGDDPSQANRYVQVPVVTGMGEARNIIVVKTSRALIAVEGRYGTLSEIAVALKIGRPVVGLRTWQLWRHGQPDSGIHYADSPLTAVEKALALAKGAK